jgi:hypothetical protein
MEIDHDFQASSFRPVKSFAKDRIGTLNEGLALVRDYTPVADRDSHMVHAHSSNLVQVSLCNEGIPVLAKLVVRLLGAQRCAESPFVYGGAVEWREE